MLLTALRYSLTHYLRRHEPGSDLPAEYRRCRLCGILLLGMTVALGGIVTLIVVQNRGYSYPGLLIYAMAVLTFFLVVNALVNVFRTRRHGSPVLTAVRLVSLSAALVMLLSLETAMISRFGDDKSSFRLWTTTASGAVVCGLVLVLAILLIVRGARKMKE